MGSIDLSNSDNTDAWTVKLKVCRKLITFKIDTGADTSVITEATYNSLPFFAYLCIKTMSIIFGCVFSRIPIAVLIC